MTPLIALLMFDPTGITVAIIPLIAIIINYYLTKKQREDIRKEQNYKIGEVHTLVNGDKMKLEDTIKKQEAEIAELKQKLQGELDASGKDTSS